MFESILPTELETLIYQKLHAMYMCDIRRELKDCLVRYNYNGYSRFYVFGGAVKPFAKRDNQCCII